MPLYEGLSTAHSILIGAGIRDKIKLIAAGKVVSGFSILRLLALGADFCNAARAMMFSLGCIQVEIHFIFENRANFLTRFLFLNNLFSLSFLSFGKKFLSQEPHLQHKQMPYRNRHARPGTIQRARC